MRRAEHHYNFKIIMILNYIFFSKLTNFFDERTHTKNSKNISCYGVFMEILI